MFTIDLPGLCVWWRVLGGDGPLLGLLSQYGMSRTLSGGRARQFRSRSHIRVRWGRPLVQFNRRVSLTWSGLSKGHHELVGSGDVEHLNEVLT